MVDDADIEDDADDEWVAENMDEDIIHDVDCVDEVDMNASRSTMSTQLSTNTVTQVVL